MPLAATLTGAWIEGNPGPAGADFITHIRRNGTNITSTPVTIELGETNSLDAAVQPTFSATNLALGDWIDFDITQVGVSPNQGQNYVIVLEVTPP
jgi:hypothetical protein